MSGEKPPQDDRFLSSLGGYRYRHTMNFQATIVQSVDLFLVSVGAKEGNQVYHLHFGGLLSPNTNSMKVGN
jgi:hypothetical protein